MLDKQMRFARDTWKAVGTKQNIKRFARRAVDVGGTSMVAFAFGHLGRPLALLLFLGVVVWLETNDPEEENGDIEEIDELIGVAKRQYWPGTKFVKHTPQSLMEQVRFWQLMDKARASLNMRQAAKKAA